MPVDTPAAIAEPERFAPRQDVQQRLRFLGQGPGSETGAAERQLGRLDADQAHMGAAVEDEGVAVDELAHAAALDDFGVATRLGRDTAVRVGEELRGGKTVDFVRATAPDEASAWKLFRRRDDKDYSFTDCVSFVLMRRLGIDRAAALDDDFRREGFAVLP